MPVGNAPRLPYLLWVTYSDGKGEYRQVKWLNSSEATEKAEADPAATPAGTIYKVNGVIIGDDSTPNGYPVAADVKVVEGNCDVPPCIPIAETLPLNQVSIDGDNRLTWNRDLDIDHLLTLPVKQQLYNYRDTYGLPTDGYPESDGWDSPTTKLKGHGSGHYMSALAFAFACCQDAAKKALLRKNIREMVDGLRECQERTFVWNEKLGRYWEARDFAPEEELKLMQGTWADFDNYKKEYQKYGYGYLNAIPAQHCALIEMYRAYNNESWVWAPYYSVHKQLAGLIDIATYIDDNETADKALLIAKDMGLWVWNRLHYRTYVKSDGRQDERRARPGNRYEMWNMYIAGEVGGMAESLARLSEMTGSAEEKAHLLEAATYFDSPAFFDPLSRNIDAIRTRHANQHIPMVTGALRTYRGNHNPYYYYIAQNFWSMIQGRYRYAMGGVGNGEMFRQPYSQITSMLPEPTLNETCCAYNLAKLTKDLNCLNPDDARYMDYYERVLYNQIVGSVNPRKYQTTYQYAVGLNASKPWGNETPQSSCCGGTGAENHVKYQEAVYFVSSPSVKGSPTLWVALYMPTTAHWVQQGVTIKQECLWPAECSTIRILANGQRPKAKSRFAIKLRVPYWATEGFDIKLNGKSIASHYQPSSYVEIPARKWSEKDVVEVVMPFIRHIDFGPDKMEGHWVGAFMRGPLVMAATGINTWDEATVDVDHDISSFIPDYDGDQHLTHYFRLNAEPTSTSQLSTLNSQLSTLKDLLLIVKSRSDEQQAWEALDVKVPEYAPWAKHGFARMKEQAATAQAIADAPEGRYSQEEIEKATNALNTTINTMRPGNLAEVEDLEELKQLINKANTQWSTANSQLSPALDYANMVIRYVTDGSGTRDMIERATKQLKDIIIDN